MSKIAFLLLFLNTLYSKSYQNQVQVLTKNFFANLEADPKLIHKPSLNHDIKFFIDHQINNYVQLVNQNQHKPLKKKRSLTDSLLQDLTGSYKIQEIKVGGTVPASFPEDIKIFKQGTLQFAVVLERETLGQNANNLVFYSYLNNNYSEVVRVQVQNGKKIATISNNNSTLVTVAETAEVSDDFVNKTGIYEFKNGTVAKIQTIDLSYSNDVSFWMIHDDLYLGLVSSKLNLAKIYKWLGFHFNFVQEFGTKDARKLTPFSINSNPYLAIANHRNKRNETKIYSEVHKFDFHTGKYELYQRILTRACLDIKFFAFPKESNNSRVQDYFLIVANFFETNNTTRNYKTNSILYKFIDDYFIPFQSFHLKGVKEWLPIRGPQEQVSLFALTEFSGIQNFEYDGWNFRETSLQNYLIPEKGVQHLYQTTFNKSKALVVVNKNNPGIAPNIFVLQFSHSNHLQTLHDKAIIWCNNHLAKMSSMDNNYFDKILGEAQRADINENNSSTDDSDFSLFDEDQMNEELDSLNLRLDSIHERLENPNLNQTNAKEIIFNKKATFYDNLQTETINHHETDKFLQNKITLSEELQLPELHFDSLRLESQNLSTKMINNRNLSQLVYQNSNLNLESLMVSKSLISPKIKIDGHLNDIKFDTKSILLNDGNQVIPESVHFEKIEIENLKTVNFNGKKLSQMVEKNDNLIKIDRIDNLRLKSLFIGGYINDVDIATLDKYALKKTGDQMITSKYSFDSVSGPQITGKVSGRNLSELLAIDGKEIVINQDLIFKQPLIVNNLTVLEFLNGIEVIDGKLDVLLKNSEKEQVVTGFKSFNNMIITNSINLHAKIKNENFNQYNSVISIEDELIIHGNRSLHGLVTIENLIAAKNIQTKNGKYSVTKLQELGLKLTDKQIQPQLRFTQQLNVEEIFVDQINEIEPDSFVVNGGDDVQIIHGKKTFQNQVFVTGPTHVNVINAINLSDLENNVMTIDGDQVITAKHHFQHLITEKIATNELKLNGFQQSALNFSNQAEIGDAIIDGDLETISLFTNNLTVLGKINGLNFMSIVADTVMKNSSKEITGHKIFENLHINKMKNGPKHFELDEMNKILENNEVFIITVNNQTVIPRLDVKNLEFSGSLNGINKDRFWQKNEDGDGNQLVFDERNFDTIRVLDEAFINTINNIPVKDLIENSVKIDEPHHFNFATFSSSVVSKATIILNGQVENLDFDNIVLSDADVEQVISDEKEFNDVYVTENVDFVNKMSGFNLTHFCQIANNHQVENLVINGSAYFAKGPKVTFLNQHKVEDIIQKAWFSNRNTILDGNYNFSSIIFNDNVTVKGLLDNVNVSSLGEEYFSKSKAQTIPGSFAFENTTFDNVEANEILVNDKVNDVDLEELTRSILMDHYDQVFESIVYLETCIIKELTGDYIINHMDLSTDVVRYDKINMITGQKSFKNLKINSLKTEKPIKIQGVDILNWFKNSAMKLTSCNITVPKTLKNASFLNGIELEGTINKLKINENNVLLKNVPQEITGRKTIISHQFDPVTFKSIKLKGLINNISMSELINNQVYKNKENEINTVLNLNNNITANNLIIAKNFDGVNMTELLNNVTNLGALNNLLSNYEDLLKMSEKLHESLKNQAYYIHHYKVVQNIPKINNSMAILCPDHVTRIATITNGSTQALQMFGWHPDDDQFILDSTYDLKTHQLNYLDQVANNRYLYIEEAQNARFFDMDTQIDFVIPTNRTRAQTSFRLPTAQNCILFVYFNNNAKILCEKNGRFELEQVLETPRALQVTSGLINKVPYLMILNEPIVGIEAQITVWKWDEKSGQFDMSQSIFAAEPKSLSFVNYSNGDYLAIASGHLQYAMHSGGVEILKFSRKFERFEEWQNIKLDAPLQIEFAKLPSDELALYVLTDNPTAPFFVYLYSGIEGFRKSVVGSTLPNIKYISTFMDQNDRHFIVAQSEQEINIIQAVFKGEKVD